MTNASTVAAGHRDLLVKQASLVQRLPLGPVVALALAAVTVLTGCRTPQAVEPVVTASDQSEALTLREGDVLKITFPGAPTLDTTQEIRRDGRIVLSLVGEVTAAGMTPAELEKEIVKLYSSQLVAKEATVTVVSSSFPVFVTGAVIKPGKFSSNHPITVLEAIMEAGGFDYAKANLRGVVVIRNEGGRTKNHVLNLKLVLDGKQNVPFYLKPSDIVYVPVRFAWF
jgi:polysaccharide export outer membrane protein